MQTQRNGKAAEGKPWRLLRVGTPLRTRQTHHELAQLRRCNVATIGRLNFLPDIFSGRKACSEILPRP
jgi:hypothetical protein